MHVQSPARQVGLTAELRVLAVFLMIHVLGSQCSIFNTDTHNRVCEHVLTAGSSLVLILTAVRNKRPYNDVEWDEIFGPVSIRFFRALDLIKHWENHRKVSERRQYNVNHPESPKKLKEFTCEERDPLDSSDNETDDEYRSLVGFFDRSRCILPHAVLHFKSQVKWGGTHRFHDAASVEAKHRVSLKSHGQKIRVRSDTQTEKDLLRVTQEELVFEALQELLEDEKEEDPPDSVAKEIAAYRAEQASRADPQHKETIILTNALHIDKRVYGTQVEHLVHPEVLLSWGEVFKMFIYCFPAVQHEQNEAKWGVYQHALHEVNGTRYHYWGTDTGYPAISRGDVRRRRDMVRVSLGGEHRAEIVCFVRARLPGNGDSTKSPEVSAYFFT